MLGSKQQWRDLIGYYTRFGEVEELLNKIDDRYVIVNSGDEMSLRFNEQPPPPAGWVRDFVISGRWLDQGWRLQLDLFEDRAATALSRQETNTSRRRAGSRMSGCTSSIPKTGRSITLAT